MRRRFRFAQLREVNLSDLRADNSLDWSRLAEPQADQYDTDAILDLAASTTSAERPQPYRRTPVGDSPAVFDGQVAVRSVYRGIPEGGFLAQYYLDAPLGHFPVHDPE